VRVYGRVSLYKKTGELRFIGEFADKAGQGTISQNLEALEAKLLAEGCFENSRPIPKFPQKIAIVTSPIGAAIADMLKIIKGRNPLIEVLIIPVLVQGVDAPADIARGIEIANEHSFADVIIVGRGGGSAEDLWAFNSEEVVRAVFKSSIPILSAVGHQTDTSLCDFAADMRCATPTEAAQLATSSHAEMLASIEYLTHRLNFVFGQNIKMAASGLIDRKEMLEKSITAHIDKQKQQLIEKSNILEKISPMAVLKRGFAAVADTDGESIKLGAALETGQLVSLHFSDTIRKAEVL